MAEENKRILIYKSVLSLLKDNHELSKIKVADIAERANIGKGTVYEYFQSKEQIIGEAIFYTVEQGLNALEGVIKKDLAFKESFYMVLEHVSRLLCENKPMIKFFTFSGNNFSMDKSFYSYVEDKFKELQRSYMKLYELIIDKGVEEGIIANKPHPFDWYVAVNAAVMCILLKDKDFEEFKDITKEEAFNKAYNILIKLLN